MSSDCISQFSSNVKKLLLVLGDILDDLFENNLVNFNSQAVEIIVTLIESFGVDNMIWSLCTVSDKWSKVIAKDTKFITEDFADAIRKSKHPIDSRIFTSPFICYQKIKSDPKWEGAKEEEYPVAMEDLECIWKYIHKLICLSCVYVHQLRENVKNGIVSEKLLYKEYKDVDLESASQLFGVKLL